MSLQLPTAHELVACLFSIIDGNFLDAPSENSRPEWTQFLARKLAERAPAGTTPHGHLWRERGFGEWLVDQSWCEMADFDQLPTYRGMVLAMECEWDGSSVDNLWADFLKLLDVRADRRVFVGWLKDWSQHEKLIGEWAATIRDHRHTQPTDTYSIVLTGKRDESEGAGWVISGNGRIERIEWPPESAG